MTKGYYQREIKRLQARLAEAENMNAKAEGIALRLAEAERYIDGRHAATKAMNAHYEVTRTKLAEATELLSEADKCLGDNDYEDSLSRRIVKFMSNADSAPAVESHPSWCLQGNTPGDRCNCGIKKAPDSAPAVRKK